MCVCVCVCGECFLAFVSSGFMYAHFWCQKKSFGHLVLNPTIVMHACVTIAAAAAANLYLRIEVVNFEAEFVEFGSVCILFWWQMLKKKVPKPVCLCSHVCVFFVCVYGYGI